MRQIFFIVSIFILTIRVMASEYFYLKNQGISFSWSSKDIACAYTTKNTRIRLTVQETATDPHNITFTGNGWSLVSNTQYFGYHPYNSSYFEQGALMTALPISYLGQMQEQNNIINHISLYDFMTTQAMSTDDVTFNFNHLGSIIRFAIDIDNTETLTSLTLSTNGDATFTTEATMDVTNNTITATATDTAATLKLNDITIEGGSQLIAYMMMAPGNYSDKLLTLTLTNADGNKATASLNGTTILAGKTYPIEIKALTGFFPAKEEFAQATAKAANITDAELPETAINAATSIPYPKGYAPDFLIDKDNKMTEFILMGDADDDGEVTMNDANKVLNNYLGNSNSYINKAKSDIDGDGKITKADADGIVNIYLSK